MNPVETFFWAVFPWLAVGVCLVGTLWRWRYDQFGWTTRSSQIYESKWLRISSPLFHYGILGVAAGHLVGLGVPKQWTESVGVSEGVYHAFAAYIGSIFGLMAVVGLAGLFFRRYFIKTIHLATSTSDKVMYVLLGGALLLGFFATVRTQIFAAGHGYDYRESISPWFRSLFALHPRPELMADVPMAFKLHVIAGFILIAAWPFTRLVHAISAPVGYTTRPYIVYRSRTATLDPGHRPGWTPVHTRPMLAKGEAEPRGA